MEGNNLRLAGHFSAPPANHDANDLVDHRNRLHDFIDAPPCRPSESRPRPKNEAQRSPVTLAEFVKAKFLPECVAHRKLAGRTHYDFVLRFVLKPEQADCAFGIRFRNQESGPKSVPDWPYLGSRPLHLIDQAAIQSLTSAALEVGYSTQTAIHIRNVIRSIFVHAIKTKHFVGDNPASLVLFPAVIRKATFSLTVSQLKQTMQLMRYPERLIALLAVLTDMNLSEICGLQWRYLNLSSYPRLVEPELLPARTIAVRHQSYRGEFRPVIDSRRRLLSIPDALFASLCNLKAGSRFSGSHDFVFASRRGTPINPHNFGTRRLKAVGIALEMPWLSWSVFHRTHVHLKSQFGQGLSRELEQILPMNDAAVRNVWRGSVKVAHKGQSSSAGVD
jgi:integrase